jgi:alpha-methylacyl-CoA racemase
MFLADLGADVVMVERPGGAFELVAPEQELSRRGKRSVVLDLKQPAGVGGLLELVAHADVLIEGNRPGVTERLGVGPDECLAVRPSLVYGRMTGWGQDGPLAQEAGHDIDYIALTGALHAIGPAQGQPQIPLNLVGDFGGGGMYLAAGVLAALFSAARTGRGQVVDAAMVDGAAHLMTMLYGMLAGGIWHDRRASNEIDGGSPFYQVYRTADDRWLAVGAGSGEPKFFTPLLAVLGLPELAASHHDRDRWPEMAARISAIFQTRTSAEWLAAFEGTDACVAPVLSMTEAPRHPHLRARGTFVAPDGVVQPAPSPRFSLTRAGIDTGPPLRGQHSFDDVLDEWRKTP